MAVQSMVAFAFILLSIYFAALIRLLSGRLGWIIANVVVVLGGILALWLTPDWAGWLTAGLFALLIACPLTLLYRARFAEQRGRWKKAARLRRFAVLLHPSPWARFFSTISQALSANGPGAYTAALKQIEATGSRTQKALARLLLAHEQRDWETVLVLSRAGDVDFAEAKPLEIRALGELGRLDEMVQAYRNAKRWLFFRNRQECMLFVFAFTGRIERVQQLVDGPLVGLDEESNTYWIAVARLRRDGNDEAARSMLRKLSETGTGDGVRRSAAQQLRRAIQEMSMSLSLIGESERVIDAMSPVSRFEQLERWAKRSRKARMRAALLLLLMAIIWVVLQSHYEW